MSDQVALSQTDLQQLRDLLDQAGIETGSSSQQGADTFSADAGQVVAPDGTVTYDFDAHVHARGLDLDANTGMEPSNDREVRWIRQPDGGVLGQLFAYDTTSAPQRAGITLWGGAQPDTYCTVEPSYDKVNDVSELIVNVAKRGPAKQVCVLDDLGRSNFLTWRNRGAERFAAGGTVVTFAGGSPFTGIPIVHNLGSTVIEMALATCSMRSDGGINTVATFAGVIDANRIQLWAYNTANTNVAAGVTLLVYWLIAGA